MARIQLRPASEGSTTGLASPRASGEMFDRSAGNLAGSGFQQIAAGVQKLNTDLTRIAEEQEVTAIQASLAQARSDWTVSMAKKAQESGVTDPEFAKNVMTEFDAYAGQMGGQVKTAAGNAAYTRGMAQLRASMSEKAGLYQVGMAGERAVLDFGRLVDSNRNTVLLDPTAYSTVRQTLIESINDPTSSYNRMPGNKRQELLAGAEKALALSAVQGTINLDPELAKKQIKDGKWSEVLDADNTASLIGQADQAIRGKEAESERQRRKAKQEQEEQYDKTRDSFVAKLAAGTLTNKEILASNLPPTGEGSKEHYINAMRYRSREAPIPERSDPKLFRETFEKVARGEMTESQVEDAWMQSGGKLSYDNMTQLRERAAGRKTTEGQVEQKMLNQALQSVERMITKRDPMTGFADPKGEENWIAFNTWFMPEFQKQRRAGKSAQALLDPDSPDSLTKEAKRYVRPWTEFMQEMVNPNGSVTPRPSAETPAIDVSKATRKGKDKTGKDVYQIDGQWLYGNGGAYKP